MDDENKYGLALSFEGIYATSLEETAFVCGVEFGVIYEQMKSGKHAEIEEPTHTANRSVLARAAAAEGWSIEVTQQDDTWDVTKLVKTGKSGGNPHGLHILQWPDRRFP